MSLLDICREASRRLGLESGLALISVTSPSSHNATSQRLLALANEAARSQVTRGDWQALTREVTFVTTATEEQTDPNAYPGNVDHIIVDTAWNRTMRVPMVGPLTPSEWAQVKGTTTVTPNSNYWRIRGSDLFILGPPPAGQTIAYEYVTKLCVAAAPPADQEVGTKTLFTLDTDTYILDNEMLTLEIVWRYRASRGLPYAEAMRSSELRIADMVAKDKPRKMMDMSLNTSSSYREPRKPQVISIPGGGIWL